MIKLITLISIIGLLISTCSCESTISDYRIYLLSPGDGSFNMLCETYEIHGDSISYVDTQGFEGFVIVPEGWALVIDRRADD